MKCKICEKEFELKKEEKYLATEKVAAFGTLAKLPKTFEAFACPLCGCQNMEEFTFGTMDQNRGVAIGVHRGN